MSDVHLMANYAVRYCMTRSTYAFDDGLAIAYEHWSGLSEATKRDVKAALADPPLKPDPILSEPLEQLIEAEGL